MCVCGQVVSPSELSTVKEAQERAVQEAARRQDEVSKRRQALDAAAEARRRREEEAIHSREVEFENQREEKEREERDRAERERAFASRTPAGAAEDGPLDTTIDDAYLRKIAEDRKRKWVSGQHFWGFMRSTCVRWLPIWSYPCSTL